jgi:Fe-S-cluster containining protein
VHSARSSDSQERARVASGDCSGFAGKDTLAWKMQLSDKLNILEQLYDVYEGFSAELDVACARGCSACCTENVTMTTLEGYRIVHHLIDSRQFNLVERLRNSNQDRRFQPAMSTNELAAMCLRQEAPPEDHPDSPREDCPFLSGRECLIYLERPFGCRCFLSTQPCEKNGFAEIDPFVITVNTVFLQFIEHVDAGGLFGNMTDILCDLAFEPVRRKYEAGEHIGQTGKTPVNRPIPGLLVPPEDQERIGPILEEIRRVMEGATAQGA